MDGVAHDFGNGFRGLVGGRWLESESLNLRPSTHGQSDLHLWEIRLSGLVQQGDGGKVARVPAAERRKTVAHSVSCGLGA